MMPLPIDGTELALTILAVFAAWGVARAMI